MAAANPSPAELKAKFESMLPVLTTKFLDYSAAEHKLDAAGRARLARMIEYTCAGGKMYRGLLTFFTVRDIHAHRGETLSEERTEAAIALGWCIEILQACFLVADDIMDASVTRRGMPCWYKVPEVQLDAVNDTLILESFMYFVIRHYFKKVPANADAYVPLLEVFQDVSYQTQLGQMLDLVSQPQGRERPPNAFETFNLTLYKRIVQYKTAYYTFYLPCAAGMIFCGLTGERELAAAKQISIELGEKFQIQDDYLDCYGEPAVIGKVGTDIQDHKCTWLLVQALLVASPEQRARLQELYGHHDDASVAEVKKMYNDLGIPAIFDRQEEDSFARIQALIADAKTHMPTVMFDTILGQIHRRQK